MENKQTPVEWAEDKLSDLTSAVVNGEIAPEEYHEIRVNIWDKAKAMEKEQMMNFAIHLHKVDMSNTGTDILLNEAEQYYNETYNQTK